MSYAIDYAIFEAARQIVRGCPDAVAYDWVREGPAFRFVLMNRKGDVLKAWPVADLQALDSTEFGMTGLLREDGLLSAPHCTCGRALAAYETDRCFDCFAAA